MDNFFCSPPAENTPERIAFLKESIQQNFDTYNWNGSQHARLLMIAGQAELVGYGVIFEPEYNCPA